MAINNDIIIYLEALYWICGAILAIYYCKKAMKYMDNLHNGLKDGETKEWIWSITAEVGFAITYTKHENNRSTIGAGFFRIGR